MSALPTYAIIGAGKCGTTSLHHYLGEHPEIQVSRRKELRFFLDEPMHGADRAGRREVPRGEWHRGTEWYRSWFSPGFAVRGEATPGYMSPRFAGVAERMRRVIPEAKLIVCVRDPVARALSHYRQAREDWYEQRGIGEVLGPGSIYVESSRYAERLAPFLEHWGAGDIHVVAQEELLAHRRETLSGVFAFLGVAPHHWSPSYDTRLNVSERKAGPAWGALQSLRRRPWWHHVGERAPRSLLPALDRLASARRPPPEGAAPPARELVERIVDAVRDDAERFRELTGRRFPDWPV